MIKKNFQLAEPVVELLDEMTVAYGKKSDGLVVTAGLLLLKGLDADQFAMAVAEAHRVRFGGAAKRPDPSASPAGKKVRSRDYDTAESGVPKRPQPPQSAHRAKGSGLPK